MFIGITSNKIKTVRDTGRLEFDNINDITPKDCVKIVDCLNYSYKGF